MAANPYGNQKKTTDGLLAAMHQMGMKYDPNRNVSGSRVSGSRVGVCYGRRVTKESNITEKIVEKLAN